MKLPIISLRSAYMIFLGVMVVVIIGAQLIIRHDLNQENDDAHLINKAGRERMLSQRIAKLTFYIQHDFEQHQPVDQKRMDTLQALLHDFNLIYTSLPVSNKQIDSLLTVNKVYLRKLMKAGNDILQYPNSTSVINAANEVKQNELPFLLGMERIVDAYERESMRKLQNVKEIEIFLGFLSVAILASGFILIFLPITKRLKAKNDELIKLGGHLKQKEKQYRELVENSRDMIYEISERATFDYANPAFEATIGYSKEELYTKNCIELIQEDYRNEIVEFYREQIRKKETFSYLEFPFVTKKNEIVWLGLNTIIKYEAEGRWKAHIDARDITEQKSLQQQLVESEKQYRLLSENSRDLICIHNSEGNYTFVSSSVKELLGYSPEELIGTSPYAIIHPDEHQRLREGPHQNVVNGKSELNVEYRIRKKNGVYIWMNAFTQPLAETKGYFQTSSRDITAQKEFEFVLKESKLKAEQAAQAKSEFLSMMSHEIRTPMNGIMGLTNLLVLNGPKPDQEEILRLLQFSEANLLNIINDILDFTKIEAGKVQLEAIPFNLFQMLKDTVALLDTRIREKGLELRFDYRAKKEFYVGDPVRINQIVNNILTNAIKFTSKGFVELSVTDTNGSVAIAIKDTGIGIAADKVETVFESFAQAGKDINRKFGGTGLGLSISRRLSQLMGGNIDVESVVGVGATFSIAIPLAESKEIKLATSQELIFSLPASTRVLLVEDNPSNQVVASMYLKKKGVQVAIANHGKEAVEMIASKEFDLVLMDLQMPEMDGYEAARLIREMDDPYFKEIPILALTANVLDDVEEKVLASGMNDCVSKPFKAEELLAKIAGHLK